MFEIRCAQNNVQFACKSLIVNVRAADFWLEEGCVLEGMKRHPGHVAKCSRYGRDEKGMGRGQ